MRNQHWTQTKTLKHGGVILPYSHKWFNGYVLSDRQTNVYNALSFDVDNAITYHGKDSKRIKDAEDVRARYLDSCFTQILNQKEASRCSSN